MICSYLVIKTFDNYSEILFSNNFKSYWWISWELFFIEFIVWIILFFLIISVLKNKVLSYFQEGKFFDLLEEIKAKLPFITSLEKVNEYLKKEFQSKFSITHVHLQDNTLNYNSIILDYFNTDNSRMYFMNDIVFIEENKNKLWNYNILTFKKIKAYIIFPLRDTQWKTVWIFEIWNKSLKDPYYTSEILDLYKFTHYIRGHLKYLSVYKRMQDLSINLDKKVDEKTIEFNNLLNKQKEFIAYVWHEIKNPITNTLFLSDSIRQDINWKVDKGVQEDAGILYDELVKVSKLVKYIFSAEKFDLDKTKLYRSTLNISKFMQWELDYFQHNYKNINFTWSIQEWIIYEIDEIQFRQVIQNLINNAIKFINRDNPKIQISLGNKWKNIIVTIEDNWEWFSKNDSESIFDKYITGSWNATGLGMGLYLCKKIIELHDWDISVSQSDDLGWAKFTIRL